MSPPSWGGGAVVSMLSNRTNNTRRTESLYRISNGEQKRLCRVEYGDDYDEIFRILFVINTFYSVGTRASITSRRTYKNTVDITDVV